MVLETQSPSPAVPNIGVRALLKGPQINLRSRELISGRGRGEIRRSVTWVCINLLDSSLISPLCFLSETLDDNFLIIFFKNETILKGSINRW